MEITETPIQKFYSDLSVFVTGATGFLGKSLLEKLLRSCPDLKRIYVLVREKKGKNASDRIQELFTDCLFAKLSDKLRAKVTPITGDIQSVGLGLTPQDRNLLKSEVSVVFHVAATVKFDEKLKLAIEINLNGTKEILELSKQMCKLEALIHVSTAYSNCHLSEIDEKFYKYPMHHDDLLKMLAKLKDKEIEELTPRLLGEWPNTYTFTKAMAESLIKENCGGTLPLAIFRPAIVVSTYKEPVAGWIDNVYGPTGICAGALMGVLGTLQCDENTRANIVPVDMTVNALIATAWDVARIHRDKQHQQQQECPIYNYVASAERPVTWGEYCTINIMYGYKYPVKDAVWYMNFSLTNSAFCHQIYMVVLHLIPAVLGDGLSLIIGKKPRLLKIYKQTLKFTKIISYFCNRDWIFRNNAVQELWTRLDDRDKSLYFFNMAQMDWLDYFKTYSLGIRLYLLKDRLESLPEARRKQTRLFFAAKCLKFILYYVSVYTVFCMFQKVFKFVIKI